MATGSNGLTWKGCDVLDARRRASSGHRPAAVISFQHAHGLTAELRWPRGYEKTAFAKDTGWDQLVTYMNT